MLFRLGVVSLFALALSAGKGQADNILGAVTNWSQTNNVVDPAGYFRTSVSSSFFKCTTAPRLATCAGALPVAAELSIQSTDVPSTATLGLIALNALESYEKMPKFNLLKKGQTVIDQVPAFMQTFLYYELNNIQRPVWVHILSALQGTELLTVKIKCQSQTCAEYKVAIDQVFQLLKIAKLNKAGMPIQDKQSDQDASDQSLDGIIKNLEF